MKTKQIVNNNNFTSARQISQRNVHNTVVYRVYNESLASHCGRRTWNICFSSSSPCSHISFGVAIDAVCSCKIFVSHSTNFVRAIGHTCSYLMLVSILKLSLRLPPFTMKSVSVLCFRLLFLFIWASHASRANTTSIARTNRWPMWWIWSTDAHWLPRWAFRACLFAWMRMSIVLKYSIWSAKMSSPWNPHHRHESHNIFQFQRQNMNSNTDSLKQQINYIRDLDSVASA